MRVIPFLRQLTLPATLSSLRLHDSSDRVGCFETEPLMTSKNTW